MIFNKKSFFTFFFMLLAAECLQAAKVGYLISHDVLSNGATTKRLLSNEAFFPYGTADADIHAYDMPGTKPTWGKFQDPRELSFSQEPDIEALHKRYIEIFNKYDVIVGVGLGYGATTWLNAMGTRSGDFAKVKALVLGAPFKDPVAYIEDFLKEFSIIKWGKKVEDDNPVISGLIDLGVSYASRLAGQQIDTEALLQEGIKGFTKDKTKFKPDGPKPSDTCVAIPTDLPILILHPKSDTWVPVKHSEELLELLQTSGHKNTFLFETLKGSHFKVFTDSDNQTKLLCKKAVNAFFKLCKLPYVMRFGNDFDLAKECVASQLAAPLPKAPAAQPTPAVATSAQPEATPPQQPSVPAVTPPTPQPQQPASVITPLSAQPGVGQNSVTPPATPPQQNGPAKSFVQENAKTIGISAVTAVALALVAHGIYTKSEPWLRIKYGVLGRYEELTPEARDEEVSLIKSLQSQLANKFIDEAEFKAEVHKIVRKYHPKRRHEILDLVKPQAASDVAKP